MSCLEMRPFYKALQRSTGGLLSLKYQTSNLPVPRVMIKYTDFVSYSLDFNLFVYILYLVFQRIKIGIESSSHTKFDSYFFRKHEKSSRYSQHNRLLQSVRNNQSQYYYWSLYSFLTNTIMKSQRYVYIDLANEGRLKKLESDKRKKKGVHQLYLKSRQTMIWRIKHFAKKQNYQYVIGGPLMYVQQHVRNKFHEYEQKLVKYWGGGKYFKKMGRMDKVRYKQQNGEYQKDEIEKQQFQIFHELDVKFSKWNLFRAFKAISSMKKPQRNIEFNQQNQ